MQDKLTDALDPDEVHLEPGFWGHFPVPADTDEFGSGSDLD